MQQIEPNKVCLKLCRRLEEYSLDTPLPLNRDRKGLGTQAVKMCTFMPRNRRPNQIARATCSFVLSHDLTWCQREEKGLLTQKDGRTVEEGTLGPALEPAVVRHWLKSLQ